MSVSTFLYMLLAPFLVRFALYKTLLYVEALLLVKGREKVVGVCRVLKQFRQAVTGDRTGSSHHLHRKTQVLPSELAQGRKPPYAISRSDLQCFSHEDVCFAAENEAHEQPA